MIIDYEAKLNILKIIRYQVARLSLKHLIALLKFKKGRKMTGLEKARETAEALKKQNQSAVVRVEHTREVSTQVTHSIGVSGFDELPTSIIPLGYYRLIQANSKGVTSEDGTRAEAGHYYTDVGEDVETVRIAVLRTKMGSHKVKKDGREVTEAIIKMLAIDTKTLSPFLINFTKGSFNAVGRLMMDFKKKGITKSYLYPVTLGSDFVQTKDFEYYVASFNLEQEAFNDEEMEIMTTAFGEYAGVLDKANFDEKDSAGNVIEDIPFPEEE